MREILFRAKREATNEWVYGYFVNEYDDFELTWYNDGERMEGY